MSISYVGCRDTHLGGYTTVNEERFPMYQS